MLLRGGGFARCFEPAYARFASTRSLLLSGHLDFVAATLRCWSSCELLRYENHADIHCRHPCRAGTGLGLLAIINVEAFGWRLPLILFPLDWLRLGLVALLAAIISVLILFDGLLKPRRLIF